MAKINYKVKDKDLYVIQCSNIGHARNILERIGEVVPSSNLEIIPYVFPDDVLPGLCNSHYIETKGFVIPNPNAIKLARKAYLYGKSVGKAIKRNTCELDAPITFSQWCNRHKELINSLHAVDNDYSESMLIIKDVNSGKWIGMGKNDEPTFGAKSNAYIFKSINEASKYYASNNTFNDACWTLHELCVKVNIINWKDHD